MVHRHGLGVGIVDDVCYLTAHQTKIHRYDDDPGFGGGQVELNDFDAVFHEHSQFVTFFQAHLYEAVGQAVDPSVYFGVGEPSPGVTQGNGLRIFPGVHLELLSQIHPMGHGVFLRLKGSGFRVQGSRVRGCKGSRRKSTNPTIPTN